MRESFCVHFPQMAVFSSWTQVSTANILFGSSEFTVHKAPGSFPVLMNSEHKEHPQAGSDTLLRAEGAQLLFKGFAVAFAVQSTLG